MTNIDNLESLLKKLIGLIGKVVFHTIPRCAIRLVNVYSANRSTELCSWSTGISWLTTDGVVKDEDPNSSSS